MGKDEEPIEIDDTTDADEEEGPLWERAARKLPPDRRPLEHNKDKEEILSSPDSLDDAKLPPKPKNDASVPSFLQLSQASAASLLASSSSDEELLLSHRPVVSKRAKLPGPALKQNTKKQKADESKKKEKDNIEKHQREQAKQEREREKLLAKEQRERDREKQKREKADKKEAEKAAKELQKEHVRQKQGKYCKSEVVVLVESQLYRTPFFELVKDTLDEASYMVEDYCSLLGCNNIQWIRRDHAKGGATAAFKALEQKDEKGFQRLPVMAIVFDDPHKFIDMLNREDDDFPDLELWLRSVESGWRAARKSTAGRNSGVSDAEPRRLQRPRTLLFLINVTGTMHELWTGHRSKPARQRGPEPPSDEMLQDAIVWMMVQFQVECVLCDDARVLARDLAKMTRMLAEEPYQRVYTDLDCFKKYPRQDTDESSLNDQAREAWMRQLQCIPRVSYQMARQFAQHYPTAHSLWLAYQNENLSEAEKRELVAGCFYANGSQQLKLSAHFYQIMTSNDPNLVLR